MRIAHINIGSNIGDSRSAIERAVAAVFSLSHPTAAAFENRRHPREQMIFSTVENRRQPRKQITFSTVDNRSSFPRRSSIVESEPWGFDSPNRFLNIGVEILTDLPPLDLLDRLQEIERAISPCSHRNPDGTYRDRLIDLDLIFLLPLSSLPPSPLPPSSLPASPLPPSPLPAASFPASLPASFPAASLPASFPAAATSVAFVAGTAFVAGAASISSRSCGGCLAASLRFSHPRLTLPHPHAGEREFVMAPIRELWG